MWGFFRVWSWNFPNCEFCIPCIRLHFSTRIIDLFFFSLFSLLCQVCSISTFFIKFLTSIFFFFSSTYLFFFYPFLAKHGVAFYNKQHTFLFSFCKKKIICSPNRRHVSLTFWNFFVCLHPFVRTPLDEFQPHLFLLFSVFRTCTVNWLESSWLWRRMLLQFLWPRICSLPFLSFFLFYSFHSCLVL